MKPCAKCEILKDPKDFYKTKTTRDGLYSHCKACHKNHVLVWHEKNPEKRLLKYNKWRLNNIQHVRNWHALNWKKRFKSDINFRLASNLRSRLRGALKNNTKTGSAIRDLGCTVKELKKHLKSQFKPGMSWKNYGKWHIDHIKPLSSFDLTNKVEFLQAAHYSNLQPLWAKDNMKKGAKGV